VQRSNGCCQVAGGAVQVTAVELCQGLNPPAGIENYQDGDCLLDIRHQVAGQAVSLPVQ
jgi:hypothetical protein